MRNLILATVLALAAPFAMAQSTHTHGQSGTEGHAGHKEHMEGVHAEATLNAIDGSTVNVSHGPIPDIGWPAMTMDLGLLDGAKVGDVEPGDSVMLMLEKGTDGMYGIRAMMPME